MSAPGRGDSEGPPSRRTGQLPHHRRGIRSRRDLRHELFDLTPRPVGSPLEQGLPVLGGEVRGELRDRGQVQPPVGQHGEEERVLPRGAGRGDPEVGLGLREVEDLGAIRKHRRAGLAGVETPRVDLANVSDEVGLVAPGLLDQVRHVTEQLVVGERRQRPGALFHTDNIRRRFGTSRDRVCCAPRGQTWFGSGPTKPRRSCTPCVRHTRPFSPVSDGSRRGSRNLSRGK